MMREERKEGKPMTNATKRRRASFRVEALIYSTCQADYDAAALKLMLTLKMMAYIPLEREGHLDALATVVNVKRLKKG
jgi:hypothetical protein